MKKIFYLLHSIMLISLLMYSYTQVDLSLTLSGWGPVVQFQKLMQHFGFFERPLSASVYSCILMLLLTENIIVALHFAQMKFSKREIILTVILTGCILLFSYPAFSYDMFNYMFTAKTVLVYQRNPYEVAPLLFAPIDTWLSFLHWTHLPSAYSPLWIALTTPIYFLGLGNFIGLLLLMKTLATISYFSLVYFIVKTITLISPKEALKSALFLAIQPIIIIELLVSGHNDSLMMACAAIGVYFIARQKNVTGWVWYAISIALKTMTIFALPGIVYAMWYKNKPSKVSNSIMLAGMIFGLVLVLSQREILGWYWLWIIPFVALLNNRFIHIVSLGISFGLITQYVPFLYYGSWDAPVSYYRSMILIISALLSCILACCWVFTRSHTSRAFIGKPR